MKRKKFISYMALIISVLLFPTSYCFGDVYVTEDGDCGEGNIPCFSSIQEAVDAALDGDIIKVARGRYKENIIMLLDYGVLLQGGWESDFRERNSEPSLTIIDGNNNGPVFAIYSYFPYSLPEIYISIDGFTIENGSYGGIGIDHIYSHGTDTTVSITNNIIQNNSNENPGGGIYARSTQNILNMVIENNIIRDNVSYEPYWRYGRGGGVLINASWGVLNLVLNHNEINNNFGDLYGGGILLDSFEGVLMADMNDNIIESNNSENGGGLAAFATDGGLITVSSAKNNIISGNEATNGGGIYTYIVGFSDIHLALKNNTITANNAYTGGGVKVDSYGYYGYLNIDLENAILWGNRSATNGDDLYIFQREPFDGATVNASYSDIGDIYNDPVFPGTYNDLGNNLDIDPFFKAFESGDYHLDSDSPLIDAGTNSGAPLYDFEHDIRPNDGDGDGLAVVDIGADEYIRMDSDGDGVVDEEDLCPEEDASGYDVDGDGCIDSLDRLKHLIKEYAREGKIKNGFARRLIGKINVMQNMADIGRYCRAAMKLKRFVKKVDAKKGRMISVDEADMIIEYASSVMMWLSDRSPESRRCPIG